MQVTISNGEPPDNQNQSRLLIVNYGYSITNYNYLLKLNCKKKYIPKGGKANIKDTFTKSNKFCFCNTVY